MVKRIIPFVHDLLKNNLTKQDIVIDATCGNGQDTLFLSQYASHVFAFDIQEIAIAQTRTLLNERNVDNVTLIHDSHEYFNQHIFKPIKAIVYNLGYLPGADQTITTSASSTISSIQEGLSLLTPKGLICITVYIGHNEGAEENELIREFVSSLSSKYYNVLEYNFMNKNKAPYNIIIEKLR